MLKHPFKKEITKFLKIQLLDVDNISVKALKAEGQYMLFNIEDKTGDNFNLPEQQGVRVKVRMFENGLKELRVSANYFVYEKGLDELLNGDHAVYGIRSFEHINFLTARIPDFNIRKANFKASNNFVSRGSIREAKELQHLFKDKLFLNMSDLGKNYVEFKVISFDGIPVEEGDYVYIKYYSDEIYLTSKTPSYTGTLTVFLKRGMSQYGVDGSYRHSLKIEEHNRGGMFNFKEIYNALISGQNIEHDFRKVAR